MNLNMLDFFLKPQNAIFSIWKRLGIGSFEKRLKYDALERPHYAFCVYHSARLAHLLGYEKISVAEFGVAGGRGLVALEAIVENVEKLFPVKIEIYGFDTGEGLPEPQGYRDLPYIWKPGFYKMDKEELQSKLHRSKLVFGDVKDTVPSFVREHNPAPLAAAFFDLDFWSSTLDSFKLFQESEQNLLPRIFCYCDDVISSEIGGLMNDYVGQLAAIADYNNQQSDKKLTRISGFDITRKRPAVWNTQIYVHHFFSHSKYNEYIHPDKNRQLRLN